MNTFINYIMDASDEELSAIILAVIRRYRAINPDWEVFFLSLPKNDIETRKRYIHTITTMLLHEKEINVP